MKENRIKLCIKNPDTYEVIMLLFYELDFVFPLKNDLDFRFLLNHVKYPFFSFLIAFLNFLLVIRFFKSDN